jgi:hypothetical protein
VVPRIAFVACQVERPLNIDGEIDADLDQTNDVSFKPIVSTPGFVRHIFEAKILIFRRFYMFFLSFEKM